MKKIGFILITILLIQACGKDEKRKEEASFTKIDSLRSVYLSIHDSVLLAWNVMIKDDDQKISDMKRLLLEIEVAGVHDQETYQSLKDRVENHQNLRYDEETMATSELIDEYDLASNSLANDLISFAESHPKFEEYVMMQTLTQDIRQAENRVLFLRVDYDRYVDSYNQFVEDNQEHLDEIDNNLSAQKKPYFRIEEGL